MNGYHKKRAKDLVVGEYVSLDGDCMVTQVRTEKNLLGNDVIIVRLRQPDDVIVEKICDPTYAFYVQTLTTFAAVNVGDVVILKPNSASPLGAARYEVVSMVELENNQLRLHLNEPGDEKATEDGRYTYTCKWSDPAWVITYGLTQGFPVTEKVDERPSSASPEWPFDDSDELPPPPPEGEVAAPMSMETVLKEAEEALEEAMGEAIQDAEIAEAMRANIPMWDIHLTDAFADPEAAVVMAFLTWQGYRFKHKKHISVLKETGGKPGIAVYHKDRLVATSFQAFSDYFDNEGLYRT